MSRPVADAGYRYPTTSQLPLPILLNVSCPARVVIRVSKSSRLSVGVSVQMQAFDGRCRFLDVAEMRCPYRTPKVHPPPHTQDSISTRRSIRIGNAFVLSQTRICAHSLRCRRIIVLEVVVGFLVIHSFGVVVSIWCRMNARFVVGTEGEQDNNDGSMVGGSLAVWQFISTYHLVDLVVKMVVGDVGVDGLKRELGVRNFS